MTQKKNRKHRPKQSRLGGSKAMLDYAVKQRKFMPTLVTGVTVDREVTIPSGKLGTLSIDERYQRLRIGGKVNLLIHVLRAGGQIPDPISVVRREDGTLWIVDGQQRFWAHYDTDTAIRAKIYKVDNGMDPLNAERLLYAALNNITRHAAPSVLKSHPGIGAELLRTRNANERDPMFNRVQLEPSQRDGTFTAASLVKGMLLAGIAASPGGGINNSLLPQLDVALKDRIQRHRIERYLDLAAMVFPHEGSPKSVKLGHRMPPSLPVRALGLVCHRHWVNTDPHLPTMASIKSMRRIEWQTLCTSFAERFLLVLVMEIEKKWRDQK